MKRDRPAPPRPDILRQPPRSFGWLDARLLHDGWLMELRPEALAVMALLAIAADEHGASFYLRETMVMTLAMPRRTLDECLERLLELGLIAHRPWHAGHADGVWQMMPLPCRPRP